MKKVLPTDEHKLILVDVPRAEVRDDEIEIEVIAIGVNYADVKIRFGYYSNQSHSETSHKNPEMGSEVCGIVRRTGRDAHRFAVGEKVFAVSHWGGGYAEYIVVPEYAAFRLPVFLSYEQGAAFPVIAQTAYHLVHTIAHLERGETVLIHAAAGGVGTMLVQLSLLQGAKVIALSSSDEKLERLNSLGATFTLNYREQVIERVMYLTNGEGVHAIFDGNGGTFFPHNFQMLALQGRVLLFGNTAGEVPPFNPYQLVYSSHRLLGFSMRAITATPEYYYAAYQWILERLESGKLKIEIGHRLNLKDAEEAHRLLTSRESYGKIVLLT